MMDQETAWQVVRAAYRCSADLQALLKFLKERCAVDEYKPFAIAIATVVDNLNVQLVDRALAARPELASKIQSDLAKHGHLN